MNKPAVNIETNSSVIEALKNVLANSYALFLKTQNYHWNVTGPNFRSLHNLFEEQYRDLFEANDEIAERIRALGEKVPATYTIFNNATTINDGNENANAATMVKELSDDQHSLIEYLNTALKAAENIGDESTVDMMIGRITTHEKAAWMLRSSV